MIEADYIAAKGTSQTDGTMPNGHNARIAYFSMEIAVDQRIPSYAGGLGVLSGDMLRSNADLGIPIVGVTLVHRHGYFHQHLDAAGNQTEKPEDWHPESMLELLEPIVSVELNGRAVKIRAWRYWIDGLMGHKVPVYFLDTDLPDNPPFERSLTNNLYGGDTHYRVCQEAVLGIGGVLMLRALGHDRINRFHMNECHSSLLILALLEERVGQQKVATVSEADIEAVRQQCIFTTHTPVAAAFDEFPEELATAILGADRVAALKLTHCCPRGAINLVSLALDCSRYTNGVAMQHGKVSQQMFPKYPIHAVTNGVHATTWTSLPFQELFDRHIPEWRRDNLYLRHAIGIDADEIQETHLTAKRTMIEEVAQATGVELNESILTLGFARRATAYKRADLLFSDLDRLRAIRQRYGPFQVVYGGKAHPNDLEGKALIERIFKAAAALHRTIPVIYLENYDMHWAKLLTSGVDIWLNTPHRPYEASGTSGMKAALNGVPSLSVLDGWWIEGHFEGVTGWAVGTDKDSAPEAEVLSLYDKLERVILPLYYARPRAFAEVMRSAIAVNGSFFNTQRVVSQYVMNAYFPMLGSDRDDRSSKAAESEELVGRTT
jgi:glycogen phosphorylase